MNDPKDPRGLGSRLVASGIVNRGRRLSLGSFNLCGPVGGSLNGPSGTLSFVSDV